MCLTTQLMQRDDSVRVRPQSMDVKKPARLCSSTTLAEKSSVILREKCYLFIFGIAAREEALVLNVKSSRYVDT